MLLSVLVLLLLPQVDRLGIRSLTFTSPGASRRRRHFNLTNYGFCAVRWLGATSESATGQKAAAGADEIREKEVRVVIVVRRA